MWELLLCKRVRWQWKQFILTLNHSESINNKASRPMGVERCEKLSIQIRQNSHERFKYVARFGTPSTGSVLFIRFHSNRSEVRTDHILQGFSRDSRTNAKKDGESDGLWKVNVAIPHGSVLNWFFHIQIKKNKISYSNLCTFIITTGILDSGAWHSKGGIGRCRGLQGVWGTSAETYSVSFFSCWCPHSSSPPTQQMNAKQSELSLLPNEQKTNLWRVPKG